MNRLKLLLTGADCAGRLFRKSGRGYVVTAINAAATLYRYDEKTGTETLRHRICIILTESH